MESPITGLINHFSNVALLSGGAAGVGYLFARAVKQIDPNAAFICGAVAGGIGGVVWTKGANFQSYIIAGIAIVFLPSRICQKQKLPISLKVSVCVSFVSLLTLYAVDTVWNYISKKYPSHNAQEDIHYN